MTIERIADCSIDDCGFARAQSSIVNRQCD
jgi:hypothetical protein